MALRCLQLVQFRDHWAETIRSLFQILSNNFMNIYGLMVPLQWAKFRDCWHCFKAKGLDCGESLFRQRHNTTKAIVRATAAIDISNMSFRSWQLFFFVINVRSEYRIRYHKQRRWGQCRPSTVLICLSLGRSIVFARPADCSEFIISELAGPADYMFQIHFRPPRPQASFDFISPAGPDCSVWI